MRCPTEEPDNGFTLIELLIVIVILGVLAGVVVFAVGGITDQGTASAESADERTLETAEETHRALYGTYADEPGLVAAGLLRDESELFDITLAGDDYTLWPSGSAPTTTAAGPPSPTTTAAGPPSPTTTTAGPPPSPTTTTPVPTTTTPVPTTTTPAPPTPIVYAGSYGGQSYGSGSKTLVIIGNGTGSTAVFNELQANPLADTVVIWLDSGDVATTADVDAVMAALPAQSYVVAATAVPLNGGATYVGTYMSTKWASPGTYWWSYQLGNPSSAALALRL